MFDPGDVVVFAFPGAMNNKPRPAVVVSTPLYETHRPDVIVGFLTTQVSKANAPTDYILQDWSQAGLRQPSAFRSYMVTADRKDLRRIGKLTDRDWQSAQACLRLAIAIS